MIKEIPTYIIFHHNLLYSSIPESHYEYIINEIYYPLLSLAHEGYRIGIEFNGWTLEKIAEISPDYIKDVRNLEKAGKVELIASSYTQAIFPLIPYEVNRRNVEFGIDIFKEFFGKVPEIFLLNEMVYSIGTVKLLREFGFKSFIFDWVNAVKGNRWKREIKLWEIVENEGLKILWADTYMTQKFQRFVWGDIEREDYLSFLKKKLSERPFALPIYIGDAEVFEYIPGSLNFTKGGNDFKRMKDILKAISDSFPVRFSLPSEILTLKANPRAVSIATTDYPIRTKKQDKYNVTRWAVTGRDSAKMNAQCYKLYTKIKGSENKELWKNLCFLWGSDFRTNTTDEKYLLFRNLMGYSLLSTGQEITPKERKRNRENKNPFSVSHFHRGMYFIVETPYHKAVLIKNKGLALKELIFKNKSSKPLIGTVEHGYYEDISYGADFFSFHTLIATQKGEQITDLSSKVEVFHTFENGFFKVRNSEPINLPFVSIFKEYWFSETLKVVYKLYFKDLYPMSIRLGIITLIPESFDKETLFCKTHNGGKEEETFYLMGKEVKFDMPVNYIVTARGCFGATEGLFAFGDSNKEITIFTNKSQLYTVPLLRYEELEDSFFFRIAHTICERDEVANVFYKGYNEISFELR